MKKIITLVFFTCLWASEVVGQISIIGTNNYDGTFNTGNYITSSYGNNYNLAPSTFDAGTNYYHGKDETGAGFSYYAQTVFIVRQSNKWVLQKNYKTVTSNAVYTELYHTELTYIGNNPPCNAWWIRNEDNDKVAIQLSGITCENTCSPPTPLIVNKSGTECLTNSVSLSASGCSGTYRWNTGEATSIISPIINGSYFVACDNASNCPTLSSGAINYPGTISTPSLTGSTNSIIEPNTPFTLFAGSCPSSNTLKWDDNSSNPNRVVSPSTSQVYTVKCVNGTCQSNEASWVVTVNATSTACIEHWEEIDHSTPIRFGTNLFFTKNHPLYGYELWKADLNMNNASMLKNLNTKKNDFSMFINSDFIKSAELNGIKYFIADDKITDNPYHYSSADLWRTDGTNAGTYKVKDINPNGQIVMGNLIVAGDLLYFSATDGVSNGLWRSDGTEQGTYKILSVSFSTSDYKYFNNKLYFNYSDGLSGYGFAVTDGTINGSVFLKSKLTSIGNYNELNGILYFGGEDDLNHTGTELWRTDGTPGGTTLVKDINPAYGSSGFGYSMIVFNGKLIFSGNNPAVYGQEIWTSDGTTAGTTILKDIYPGSNSSGASGFSIINGIVLFQANDGVNGTELWRTDGTTAGTFLFKDLKPGAASSNPGTSSFTLLGNKYYFLNFDISTGYHQLFETDGTASGTLYKFDIGSNYLNPSYSYTKINNDLYYIKSGLEFYKVNSTITGGTKLIGGTPQNPYNKLYNAVYFDGYLYYNPQDIGIKSIRRISLSTLTDEVFIGNGSGSSYYDQFVYNNTLIFTEANNNTLAQSISLWKSNGTIAGTVPFFSNSNVSDNDSFVANNVSYTKNYNNLFLFTTYETNNSTGIGSINIWKTDGTEAGTSIIIPNASLQFSEVIGNYLYYIKTVGLNYELWKYDGTSSLLLKSSNVYPFTFDGKIIALNNDLFFQSYDPVNGREIWKTDGTIAGTVLLKDISPGNTGIDIGGAKVLGNKIIFNISSGSLGGFWATDGTSAGTILLKSSPDNNENNLEFIEFNNNLYSGRGGRGLWKTNGTVSGTELINKVASYNLLIYNNKIYFNGFDNISGVELWVSDGTRFGTKLFKDINKGSASSNAKPLGIRGGYLYFSTNMTNFSLFKTDGTVEGTVSLPYQTDFSNYEVEGITYKDSPLYGLIQNYKLSTSPILSPNIISAYSTVLPNTKISLYITNNTYTDVFWQFRNTNIISYNSNGSITDTPPSTTIYSTFFRNNVCQSAPSTKTITISTCTANLVLASTTDDQNSGTITKQASSAPGGKITATNKITGTANATYQAKSIELNAGFKADNGVVFKAEVGGCN